MCEQDVLTDFASGDNANRKAKCGIGGGWGMIGGTVAISKNQRLCDQPHHPPPRSPPTLRLTHPPPVRVPPPPPPGADCSEMSDAVMAVDGPRQEEPR